MLLSAWLWTGACPDSSPSVLDVYDEAIVLRPEVSAAVELVNDVLSGADKEFVLVPNWVERPDSDLNAEEITVYLVRSAASRDALRQRRERVASALNAIWEDDSGLTIDEELDECTELDDCVENLYPGASLDLILEVLNNVNANEIGKADTACKCIVLVQEDLQLMQDVFGANWDGYILSLRYETVEELEAALVEDRVASALLDDAGLPLEVLISFILLHEIGHHALEEHKPLTERSESFTDSLNRSKREELAADAFVGDTLLARCFKLPRPELLEPLCLTPATLSMLTFVAGLKAKSKEARCIRFFDPSVTHPNWQLRLSLMSMRMSPEIQRSHDLLNGYLDVREGLLALDWPYETLGCGRPLDHTLSAD